MGARSSGILLMPDASANGSQVTALRLTPNSYHIPKPINPCHLANEKELMSEIVKQIEELKVVPVVAIKNLDDAERLADCLLYTSPSPRDATLSRMPSSA